MKTKTLLHSTLAMAVATSAYALPSISFQDSVGPAPGGQFTATAAGLGTFETFCIEVNESISFGNTYYYSTSLEAKYNGTGVTSDPISIPTAYLFSQFHNGTLPGYTYGDETSAGNLQKAIWWLEDEAGGVMNTFVTDAYAATSKTKADNASGEYGVFVINVWRDMNGTLVAQDVLGIPDGGLTLAMLGMAFSGLAYVRRKSK